MILGISKHQYYYQSKGSRSGRKPTETTKRKIGDTFNEISTADLVAQIELIQSDPDTNYGYHKMCTALMLMGYFINHKKLYRIMKQYLLLKERHKRNSKTYVRYRIVTPEAPLRLIEMDIKYVWIDSARKYGYILTIIDTFTRFVLNWKVGFTMKAVQVKQAWDEVIEEYLQANDLLKKEIHIEIRNDNGPQFGAKIIREYFLENHLNQVFTHPYTPQENGHVESFHSILAKSINKSYPELKDLENRLTMFYHKYNEVRLHGSIANLPPKLFWSLWEDGKITREELKKKKVKFTLNVPYQELSGNMNPRAVPCQKKVDESQTHPLVQQSVQKSPSVALAEAIL